MTTQPDLFNTTPRPQPTRDDFDAVGAAYRLRVLFRWLPSERLSYVTGASEPWQSYEAAGKAMDAYYRKVAKRKTKRTHAEGEAAFPWFAFAARVGRARVPACCPAPDAPASIVTREIAEDSARSFALIFDAPAEAVVRYVLTGEVG